MRTGVERGGSEGAPRVCRGETRSHTRSYGGTDLAEQTARLSPPSSEVTVPLTRLSHPPPGTPPMAQGNAPHRLKGGRWRMSPRPPRSHPGRALPSPPRPGLTPSHQAERHGATKKHTSVQGQNASVTTKFTCILYRVFPPSCRAGNICVEAVYNKLFTEVCETLRLSMLLIGLSPQMPSRFSYRLIKTIK